MPTRTRRSERSSPAVLATAAAARTTTRSSRSASAAKKPQQQQQPPPLAGSVETALFCEKSLSSPRRTKQAATGPTDGTSSSKEKPVKKSVENAAEKPTKKKKPGPKKKSLDPLGKRKCSCTHPNCTTKLTKYISDPSSIYPRPSTTFVPKNAERGAAAAGEARNGGGGGGGGGAPLVLLTMTNPYLNRRNRKQAAKKKQVFDRIVDLLDIPSQDVDDDVPLAALYDKNRSATDTKLDAGEDAAPHDEKAAAARDPDDPLPNRKLINIAVTHFHPKIIKLYNDCTDVKKGSFLDFLLPSSFVANDVSDDLGSYNKALGYEFTEEDKFNCIGTNVQQKKKGGGGCTEKTGCSCELYLNVPFVGAETKGSSSSRRRRKKQKREEEDLQEKKDNEGGGTTIKEERASAYRGVLNTPHSYSAVLWDERRHLGSYQLECDAAKAVDDAAVAESRRRQRRLGSSSSNKNNNKKKRKTGAKRNKGAKGSKNDNNDIDGDKNGLELKLNFPTASDYETAKAAEVQRNEARAVAGYVPPGDQVRVAAIAAAAAHAATAVHMEAAAPRNAPAAAVSSVASTSTATAGGKRRKYKTDIDKSFPHRLTGMHLPNFVVDETKDEAQERGKYSRRQSRKMSCMLCYYLTGTNDIKTRTYCESCNAFLCYKDGKRGGLKRNCFKKWHTWSCAELKKQRRIELRKRKKGNKPLWGTSNATQGIDVSQKEEVQEKQAKKKSKAEKEIFKNVNIP